MKIFQFSDLHLDEKFNIEEYQEMLEKMTCIMEEESKNCKCIHIVCCGDIVNKGNPQEYKKSAKLVFDYIKEKLKYKKIEFIFVPGNHDLCDNEFDEFQKFITQYNTKINFNSNSACIYETPYLDYVVLNTMFHKEISYGNVDVVELKEYLKKTAKPVVVVMHHTIMSRYSDDRSSISNAYEFLKQLECNKVIGVLHGHTHGYSNILVGQECRVIGVGSLFAYIMNCNNQFNVVEIGAGVVERVENYRYHFDLNDFKKEVLYNNSCNNYFESNNVYDIYRRIKESVKYHGGVNNLTLSLTTDLATYKKEMEEYFSEDVETARLWLQESVPSSLYYNHGEYMVNNDVKAINYVIDELKRNSTSNRAIIPLINFNDVLEKKFSYLPGLNIFQFGFINDDKTELCCSIYLRSLEVSNFLKINLSELFILVSNICDEIRSIKRINIHLYAFKAQYKEQFSCFKKATIDAISFGELANIAHNRSEKLIELLKNKFEMSETIIKTEGLECLYDIMSHSDKYGSESVVELENIIKNLKMLKNEYCKNSDYSKTASIEKQVAIQQQKYLDVMKKELS